MDRFYFRPLLPKPTSAPTFSRSLATPLDAGWRSGSSEMNALLLAGQSNFLTPLNWVGAQLVPSPDKVNIKYYLNPDKAPCQVRQEILGKPLLEIFENGKARHNFYPTEGCS